MTHWLVAAWMLVFSVPWAGAGPVPGDLSPGMRMQVGGDADLDGLLGDDPFLEDDFGDDLGDDPDLLDPGEDPFATEPGELFPEVSGEFPELFPDPEEFPEPEFADTAEVERGLRAFADLLAELKTRRVRQPFHELSLLRLRTWVEGAAEPDLEDRLEVLLGVARDPHAGAPEVASPASGSANPFQVHMERNAVAARVLGPLDASGWQRWLARAGSHPEALRDGLGEVVGTRQGRRALSGALEQGVPLAAVRLVVEEIGVAGVAADLSFLDEVLVRYPGARDQVQVARGRLEDRLDRHQGLGRWEREQTVGRLLEQARVRAEKREYRRAIRFVQEAVELAPSPDRARYALARYAYQVGYYQKAREALEDSIRAGVRERSFYTTYAKVLRRQGQRDDLVRFLESALDQGGGTALKVTLCNELALEYSARGDGEEAMRLAKIGLSYFVPEAVQDNLLTRYAEGLTLVGRFQEAEKTFRQALELDPGYRKARMGLEAVQLMASRAPVVDPILPDPFPDPDPFPTVDPGDPCDGDPFCVDPPEVDCDPFVDDDCIDFDDDEDFGDLDF